MRYGVFVSSLISASFWSEAAAQNCTASLQCVPVDAPPTLDGDLSEWSGVSGIETDLYKAVAGDLYEPGMATYKCMYNDTHIFFAMTVPGIYRFNSTNNKQCAAIATMFKIGDKASYYGMGGCPMAGQGCDAGVPSECDDYRVDIGAHWELSGTQQGVEYGVNEGGGDDLVANKDDEYAVSAKCRLDDNDSAAANEWSGAWVYSDFAAAGEKAQGAVNGTTVGDYIFELSRTLTTASSKTDRQFTPGETYSAGFAFWDPFENEGGWTDAGHFVTGCGAQWIDMSIGDQTSSPLQSTSAATQVRNSQVAALAGMGSLAFALL